MTTPSPVEAIFFAALDQPAGPQRAAYLADACRGNDDLRGRVERLLGAHPQVGSFLEQPAAEGTGAYVSDSAGTERPGERIGPYKLLQQLGEGGMGTVFLAEQTEPVRRKVALKIIKPGMDSATVLARFEAERQALALMDHPNIAKVLDAGTTAAGRPYFVMELVKGIPLTKFCDENHLTPKERLELFIPVCQAVQHAHQKGIIHRDLKPSNVLIALYDGKPVPKVIDFGVAKALHQNLTERTLFTEVGNIIGTLEYMSPEQAELNNLDIDTRSDIYSLGVILYELLTGSRPLDAKRLRSAAFAEMLRIIREEEPEKPSTKLSNSGDRLAGISAQRKTEPKKLSKLVRGDLDWIVMKALEKDRARRYETANGFAQDVQRYLAEEPVLAGPPGAAYRLRKYARKYRRPLMAAGAFALVLIAGAAVSAWQAVRATREATRASQAEQQARDEATRAESEAVRATKAERQARDEAAIAKAVNEFLNDDLLGQADGQDDVNPDLTPLKEVRLRTVLDRAAAQIGGKFEKQPLVEAAVRLTIGGAYQRLKEHDAAQPHLDRAWEIRRRVLGEDHPDSLQSATALAALYLNQGKSEQATRLYTQNLESCLRVLGENHELTLVTMRNLAQCLMDGENARAESLLVRSVEGFRRLKGEESIDTVETSVWLARLYVMERKYDLAEPLLLKSLEIHRRVRGENHRSTVFAMRSLATYYLSRGQYAQAEPLMVKVVEVYRRRLGEDSEFTWQSLTELGGLYLAWGRYASAETVFAEAWDRSRRTRGEDHWATLATLDRLAQSYDGQGKHAQAEPLFTKAVDGYRRANSPMLTFALMGQGNNLVKQQKYAEAEPLLRECLALREKQQPDGWQRFSAQNVFGGCLAGQKKYAEAEPLLLSGYEGMKAREVKMSPTNKARLLTEALERLVQFYEATDKPDDAAKWRKELEAMKKP